MSRSAAHSPDKRRLSLLGHTAQHPNQFVMRCPCAPATTRPCNDVIWLHAELVIFGKLGRNINNIAPENPGTAAPYFLLSSGLRKFWHDKLKIIITMAKIYTQIFSRSQQNYFKPYLSYFEKFWSECKWIFLVSFPHNFAKQKPIFSRPFELFPFNMPLNEHELLPVHFLTRKMVV